MKSLKTKNGPPTMRGPISNLPRLKGTALLRAKTGANKPKFEYNDFYMKSLNTKNYTLAV